MTKRITIETVLKSRAALGSLFSERLPAKIAFNLSRLQMQLESELKLYEQARLLLCERYGTLNDETGNYDFPDEEDKLKFATEYKELIESEIRIDVSEIDIEKLEGVNISASELTALNWLFKEFQVEPSENINSVATA